MPHGGGTVSAGGTITATVALPDGATPPDAVLVEEYCTASWTGQGAGGSCSTSKGGTPASNYNGGQYVTYIKYTFVDHPGATLGPYTCTPTASASFGAGGSGGVSVEYRVAVYPVSIDPIGAKADSSGGWHILVGQKCSPAILGGPPTSIVTSWQWNVSGTTMQSWTATDTQTTEVDGPGPLDVEDPIWFWNDPNSATPETITCTATVTPPYGLGPPCPVNLSQQVTVWLPTWSASGTGGEMVVDTDEPQSNGKDYWLHASLGPFSTVGGGMNWEARVDPPAGAPVAFGAGYLELVQILTPDMNYTNQSGVGYELDDQGQKGLDTSWPYGWMAGAVEDPNTPTSYYESNDSPGIDLTSCLATHATVIENFEDYLMYEPPDSPEYVPLGKFTWSTAGYATIPVSGSWASFANPAGTVSPSGGAIPFTNWHTYPSWTQNSGNSHGFVPEP